jgi:hypothetical protein
MPKKVTQLSSVTNISSNIGPGYICIITDSTGINFGSTTLGSGNRLGGVNTGIAVNTRIYVPGAMPWNSTNALGTSQVTVFWQSLS